MGLQPTTVSRQPVARLSWLESWIYVDALGVWIAAGKLQGEDRVGGLGFVRSGSRCCKTLSER